jgi:hypothetical protein
MASSKTEWRVGVQRHRRRVQYHGKKDEAACVKSVEQYATDRAAGVRLAEYDTVWYESRKVGVWAKHPTS